MVKSNELEGSDFYWQRNEIMYCSNVHPCSSIEGLIKQIEQHIVPIKKARNLDSMMLGLWFNKQLLENFDCDSDLSGHFFYLLKKHNLTIKTLNAFPQSEFHSKVVKTKVYQPSWSDSERLDYTIKLVDFINVNYSGFASEVSISTVPLGYKASWSEAKHQSAISNLKLLATHLSLTKQQRNIHIRVCLEMEPDCVLETTDEMVSFFQNDLKNSLNNTMLSHLGICFDICHQAVMHEDIKISLAKLIENNIVIGKIQVSNALRFQVSDVELIESLLKQYYLSPYLHQIKINSGSNIIGFADLNIANIKKFPVTGEARIHFHLPINQRQISDLLQTTQQSIVDTLSYLNNLPSKPDLEVETYTWNIIDSTASTKELNQYLVKELNWLEEQLTKFKLLKV